MELKVIVCAVTGNVVWLELQHGKCPMTEAEFARESGVMGGCTLTGCRDANKFLPNANDENDSDDHHPYKVFFGDVPNSAVLSLFWLAQVPNSLCWCRQNSTQSFSKSMARRDS